MIKNSKCKVIISSLLTLSPILIGLILWNKLPDSMITHWDSNGNADILSSKAFAIFSLPIILLIFHLICLFITSLDKKQKEQNQKALGIIFWIIPFISLFANGIVYSVALEKDVGFELFMPILFGLMFIFIGNYLPKTKQNRTLGIRISWTLNNEENWNKTHRFSGKLWFATGLILLFFVFLPIKIMFPLIMFVILIAILVPILYSYSIYKKHIKEGIIYVSEQTNKSDKITLIIVSIFTAIIFIFIAVLLFTGDININLGDKSFNIEVSYWSDLQIRYDKIDRIQYREDILPGLRTNGFGSPRLSMGRFKNDEFGNYTRYTYTKNNTCIVLENNEQILVINCIDEKNTKELYDFLLIKINNQQ